MGTENHYQYNYERLDNYLKKHTDPQEVGNELDEIMGDLVNYAGLSDSYCESLPHRHSVLRELRDIFWNLKKQE